MGAFEQRGAVHLSRLTWKVPRLDGRLAQCLLLRAGQPWAHHAVRGRQVGG